VLDQAAEGELADGGTGARLLVGQPPDGDEEQAAVLLQGLEEVGALAGQLLVGHGLSLRGGHGATLERLTVSS
jgi:hypothetical protein